VNSIFLEVELVLTKTSIGDRSGYQRERKPGPTGPKERDIPGRKVKKEGAERPESAKNLMISQGRAKHLTSWGEGKSLQVQSQTQRRTIHAWFHKEQGRKENLKNSFYHTTSRKRREGKRRLGLDRVSARKGTSTTTTGKKFTREKKVAHTRRTGTANSTGKRALSPPMAIGALSPQV